MASGPSSELVQQVDALIQAEDTTVVLAMKLSKNQASWTVAGRRGRVQSKPRIIAITAKRNPETQKFKVKIHMIKPGTASQPAELLKSYRLQALTSIELVTSDTTGRSFLLVFDEKKDSTQPQWTTRTVDDRNHLIVCLLKMSQDNLKTLPKVIGIDVVEMALWAKSQSKPLAMGGVGGPDEGGSAAEGDQSLVEQSMMAQDSLVSKVEEEDMEALLGTYVIGIDEAEVFSERLKKELGALEAANVHAILESEALVEEVLDGLDEAAERVEDMENWLNVFNVKLRHMREDIESIEAQNNMLEVQAKNNKLLLAELDSLLESLFVPPQFGSVLLSGSLDELYLPEVLDACEWLLGALAQLEPPVISAHYVQMRAVREKKAELDKLRHAFGRRATEFIISFLSTAVDNQLSHPPKSLLRGQPDHSSLRRKLQPYTRLVAYLKLLNPDSSRALRKGYCSSMNLLIRREARDVATELKGATRLTSKGAATALFAEPVPGAPERATQMPSNAESQGVSDAYSKMLKAFLPLVADEAAFMKQFLCMGAAEAGEAGGDAAQQESATDAAQFAAATEELFNGIQEDFLGLVDWGYRVEPLRCVSLAGITEQWQQQQQKQASATGGSGPGETISRKLLLELQTRIRQLFFKYVEEASGQIEKYDRGVKHTGILSFVPKFAALAKRMEGLVTNNCRDLVDQCYKKLAATIFATLEKVGAQDPRQRDVLLLENHAAFQNSTYDLAGNIATLRLFYSQSSEIYEAACNRYIDSVIMGQFDKLFEYKQKIRNLLNTIETEEIPFQIGFNKADLRKVLKSQLTGVDRSLQAMQAKMKKNLTSEELLPSLWDKCKKTFMQQYKDMEALIARCYANESISPTSREMEELFNTITY